VKCAVKILLATDGSRPARDAIQYLQLLPLPHGSAIRILSVVNIPRGILGGRIPEQTMQLVANQEWSRAHRVVESGKELLPDSRATVTTGVRGGDPAAEILLAAEEFNADMVVVGSKGLAGLEGFLLGSVARSVVKRSQRPVLIGRAPRCGLQQVVIATDGSDHADRAIQFAARLSLPESSKLVLVHGVRPFVPFPEVLFPSTEEELQEAVTEVRRQQQNQGAAVLAAAQGLLAQLGRAAETVLRVGDPTTEILAVAQERQADLIVAGARGASLIEGLLIGSVADRLVNEARCSVLIVH
jgi:nucleotide-binding universal stress UspA family protein